MKFIRILVLRGNYQLDVYSRISGKEAVGSDAKKGSNFAVLPLELVHEFHNNSMACKRVFYN